MNNKKTIIFVSLGFFFFSSLPSSFFYQYRQRATAFLKRNFSSNMQKPAFFTEHRKARSYFTALQEKLFGHKAFNEIVFNNEMKDSLHQATVYIKN